MNHIERRPLYNLLRMNWLNEPTLPVEPWQVEDYRILSLPQLFDRLKAFEIQLDRTSFIGYADECDSPEQLSDYLVGDRQIKTSEEDQIYLVVFELWRRLLNEKPSLSILCNELDHQIFQYDRQELENPLALQDALTHFVLTLEENVDEGIPPEKAFELISSYCANDVESFLYDFIAEQIEEGSETYAQDLLEDFDPYFRKSKWFKLLRLQLAEKSKSSRGLKLADQLLEEHLTENDLDFNLEFLSILAEIGDHDTIFRSIINHTFPLIDCEEDFQDLLAIVIEYFHRLDLEQKEEILITILKKRSHLPLDEKVNTEDTDLSTLILLFNT